MNFAENLYQFYIDIWGIFKKLWASLWKSNQSYVYLLWQHTNTFYKTRKTNSDIICLISVQLTLIQRWKMCDKSKIWVRFRTPWTTLVYILILRVRHRKKEGIISLSNCTFGEVWRPLNWHKSPRLYPYTSTPIFYMHLLSDFCPFPFFKYR